MCFYDFIAGCRTIGPSGIVMPALKRHKTAASNSSFMAENRPSFDKTHADILIQIIILMADK